MKVIFLTSKEERFNEFKSLIPYETAVVKYIERSNHAKKKIEIVLPKRMEVKLEKNDLILIDFTFYECFALNGMPGRNSNFVFKMGFENIQKVARQRGKCVLQKTEFKVLNYRFRCVKKINSIAKGSLIVDSKDEIKNLDDLFVLDSFTVPFSKLPLEERAIVGSIGMATKLFIDWVDRNI